LLELENFKAWPGRPKPMVDLHTGSVGEGGIVWVENSVKTLVEWTSVMRTSLKSIFAESAIQFLPISSSMNGLVAILSVTVVP